MVGKRQHRLGDLVPFELSLETFVQLADACRPLGIDPNADLVVTDARDDVIGPGARYRAFARKTGWGIRFGRHSPTVQTAAESLLVKIAKSR